jgi:hypothetical protein
MFRAHARLYRTRLLAWLIKNLILFIGAISKLLAHSHNLLTATNKRLLSSYIPLAYDEKSHALAAYAHLEKKEYHKAFSRGWCYSLAVAGEQAGLGRAVCFCQMHGSDILVEPSHAAVLLSDGGFLDIAGYHPNLTALSDALFDGAVVELSEHDPKREAGDFIIWRAMWVGIPSSEMQSKVDAAVAEVIAHWRQTNNAPFPDTP